MHTQHNLLFGIIFGEVSLKTYMMLECLFGTCLRCTQEYSLLIFDTRCEDSSLVLLFEPPYCLDTSISWCRLWLWMTTTICWTCSCIPCLASPLAPLIEGQMQKIFTTLYHNTCLHYLFPEVFNSLYFLFNWQLLGQINISYFTFPPVCIKSVNTIDIMYWIYCRIHTSPANTLRLFNIILEASSSLSDFFCPST